MASVLKGTHAVHWEQRRDTLPVAEGIGDLPRKDNFLAKSKEKVGVKQVRREVEMHSGM